MATGVAWMVMLRMADRGIAIVSTMVLARLLVPGDFGLIALATSLIGMLEVLGAVGMDMALIQRADAQARHFNTAWTFRALFGLVTAALVAMLAVPTASFYAEPRLVPVMLMLGLTHALQSFENIGVVAFRKDLEFDREFRYRLTRRVVTTFGVTLPLAFALGNYWALLIGSVVGAGLTVVLSFWLHPYRPRPSLAAFGELMRFSKWFLLDAIAEFLYARVAVLVIGRWSGPSAVGAYSLAGDLASMATLEISAPVHRAVFPGYTRLSEGRSQLREAFLMVTALLLLVVLPCGVGVSLLAEPIVLLMFGDKWRDAIALVRVLGIDGILSVMLSSAHYLNMAAGMTRSSSIVLAAHAALTIPLLFWAVPEHGAQGAVVVMLLASVLTAPVNFYLVGKVVDFGLRDLKALVWRPLLGVLTMSVGLLSLQILWPLPAETWQRAVYAALAVVGGACVYGTTVYLLWRPHGQPESAEGQILARASRLIRAVRARSFVRA